MKPFICLRKRGWLGRGREGREREKREKRGTGQEEKEGHERGIGYDKVGDHVDDRAGRARDARLDGH